MNLKKKSQMESAVSQKLPNDLQLTVKKQKIRLINFQGSRKSIKWNTHKFQGKTHSRLQIFLNSGTYLHN